jgi:hypothetical protein
MAANVNHSGVRGVFRVLDRVLEHGETDAALHSIQPYGRQIKALQQRRPRRNMQ